MKTFLRKSLTRERFLLLVIIILAFVVRFYNFPNRITFWSEQARSLITSEGYFEKPSLLGQDYFVRQDSNGHLLFAGAFFNYLLVPILMVTKDPVQITLLFTLLNLLIGFLVFWFAKKIFGYTVGVLSSVIFLFNSYMVYHSLFIWIYNMLPLLGVLSIYFLYRCLKEQNIKYILILGLISGIGISLQILYAPIAVVVMLIAIWKYKKKIVGIFSFILAGSVANLPTIVFDLRHDFYHVKTFTQYLLDTLAGVSNASFSYYYLLPLWPLFAIGLGYALFKIYKINKIAGILLVGVYLYLNLTSSLISFKSPTGMPEGIFVADIDKASKLIADDAEGDFNVSEVLDFDKRAYVF